MALATCSVTRNADCVTLSLHRSWSTSWGLQGSFRVAYAAANVMQPDYTFALQYTKASLRARATAITRQLKPNLVTHISTSSGNSPDD